MADILDYCKGREAKTFKPGDVLIREGGQESKLYVLIDGQVEVLGWTLWRRREECEVPQPSGAPVKLQAGFGVLFEAISRSTGRFSSKSIPVSSPASFSGSPCPVRLRTAFVQAVQKRRMALSSISSTV